ncbi:hypothetical protein [Alkalihalobacterium bogoriense]|uniref:hypothetical protein n=1 Tax=Alkalihalobacterium bogoriense TaxID=246272 RepID=UPI0006868211|nr:hypothetical protein [Alkalihalobacterium bogoriense]
MKNVFCIVTLGVIFLFSSPLIFACGEEVPKNEQTAHHYRVIPFQSNGVVTVTTSNESRKMEIGHEVKENDLYIECFIHDFHFSKENTGAAHVDGEGHIKLYINGAFVDSIYKAGFIIKDLPKGEHTIKIEVVQNDGRPYELEEEFTVEITE